MRNGGGRGTIAGAADWDVKFAVPLATHLVSRRWLHARLTAGLESLISPENFGPVELLFSTPRAGFLSTH